MSSQSAHKPKLFLGMTSFQLGILSVLGLMACGVIGLLGFFVLNNTVGYTVSNFGFANPENALAGKWERYISPTPTPTLGATPTPIAVKDAFGNTYYVTPSAQKPIVIGCDFGYPPNLEFFKDGTYAGASVSVWSEMFVLQGGQYEVLDNSRIKMQTKNGFSVFRFVIEGDQLKLIDDSACEFVYSKMAK